MLKTKSSGKIKLKKNILPKKAPRLSNTNKPSELSFDEWQIALRRQFALEQKFKINNQGEHPFYSDFEVSNPDNKKSYTVAIRSPEPGFNFCSCPDFRINMLGTCKHIEYVLNTLRSKKNIASYEKKPPVRPYSSLSLRYGKTREIVLRIGNENKDKITRLASGYFETNGYLKKSAFNKVDDFLKEISLLDPEFRCYPHAKDFILDQREKNKRIQKIDKKFSEPEKSERLDSVLKTKLYPYQKRAIVTAVKEGRFLLADDMGLGKTIQSLAISELMRNELGISNVVIVCPTSLKYQWKSEIEKFTDSKVIVIEGMPHLRKPQYAGDAFYKIVSYNTAIRDIEYINNIQPDLIVLDEAQRIKNWQTKTAKSIKQLHSEHCLVLTGTPVENKLEELHSLVEFINPYQLGLLARYLYNHKITDTAGKIIGYKDLNKISESISSIYIRRTKHEVLKQLPSRIDKTIFVEMTHQQMEIHEEFKDTVAQIVNKWRKKGFLTEKERQILLNSLSCMRMISDSTYILDQKTRHDTKIEDLVCVLEEILTDKENKIVIFSQWERMTRIISKELEKMNVKYEYLHGGIPSKDRKDLLDNFANDPSSKIFLSTDAGGVGLNLQSASFVINMDCPWNPAVLEQRIGRVHRLGQARPVTVINYISKGTIEERILELLSFKKKLFAGILDHGEDMIFMGEDKTKQFMKTVEQITTGLEVSSTDEVTEEEKLFTPKDEKQKEAATGLLFNEEELTELNTAPKISQPIERSSSTNGSSEILNAGMQFFEKLAETFASPQKSKEFMNGLIHKDEKTGSVQIRIPVQSEESVNNFVSVLGNIFAAIKRN